MIDWGTHFDEHAGRITLGREGGHSHNRIVHALGDMTGREVMRAVIGQSPLASETSRRQTAPSRTIVYLSFSVPPTWIEARAPPTGRLPNFLSVGPKADETQPRHLVTGLDQELTGGINVGGAAVFSPPTEGTTRTSRTKVIE